MDLFKALAAAVGVSDHFCHCTVMRVVVQDQVQFIMRSILGQRWQLPLDWSKGRTWGWVPGLGAWFEDWSRFGQGCLSRPPIATGDEREEEQHKEPFPEVHTLRFYQ